MIEIPASRPQRKPLECRARKDGKPVEAARTPPIAQAWEPAPLIIHPVMRSGRPVIGLKSVRALNDARAQKWVEPRENSLVPTGEEGVFCLSSRLTPEAGEWDEVL